MKEIETDRQTKVSMPELERSRAMFAVSRISSKVVIPANRNFLEHTESTNSITYYLYNYIDVSKELFKAIFSMSKICNQLKRMFLKYDFSKYYLKKFRFK